MRDKKRSFLSYLFIFLLLVGCSSQPQPEPKPEKGSRDNTPVVLEPQASGEKIIGNSKITFDLSHSEDGYVMVKYTGDNPKVKVRIKHTQQKDLYTYDMKDGYNIFPLTGGNGTYIFSAYENISGTKYSQLFNKKENITIKNDYITYLYPNQYIDFNKNTKLINTAQDIAKPANNDLDVVSYVYEYVINNITYDDDKASDAKNGEMAGYTPQVDEIMSKGTGICFDYAAVMATMLRTQNIPTRMEIGYVNLSGESIYHAWISVYIKDIGWVDDLIEFNGKEWSMMDPTLISDSQNSSKIRNLIKEKTNYTTKYLY